MRGRPAEFNRKDQERLRIYVDKETKELLKEIAVAKETSIQQVVEKEIKRLIKEFK